MMMMKFLLHSWLRPDGIYTIYVYYVTSNILDPSENATLSLARVFERQQNYDKNSIWWGEGQLRVCWLRG